MRHVMAVLVLSLVAPAVLAQSADQQIVSVTDSPDPVAPGAVLTYTVNVRNNGPSPATNGGINVAFQSAITYQSASAPAGFTCTQFGQAVSCLNPAFAAGSTATITLNFLVGAHLANSPDGTITTQFSTSGTTPDPNTANNSTNVTTTYDSPQMDVGVSVTDSPDPVTPNNNITYTATVTQTGPDAATNVNFNVFNNGSLRFQSATAPAGWSCTLPAVNGNPIFTCTKATVPAGTSDVFTIVVRADSAVLGINDGTVQTAFTVNGTGNNTNTANDSETESTAYVTPDADLQITATDSPDPVAPDGDITYTVTVTNAGPDTATGTILNIPMNNTLRFTSVTTPAGWTCTPPAVGGGTSWSCTRASFPAGSSQFTIVLRANDEQFGINDTTIVQNFNTGSGVADPNNANNSVNVSTQYSTPDADLQITATDSPDPVAPDGDITYTVTVTNAGPDTATGAILNIPMNNTLRFTSVTTPAGWTCTPPAVGGGTSWSCTRASFPVGSSQFTIVLRANDEQFGINDTTIVQNFNTGSGVADPNNANNSVNVSTQYSTPDADLQITATDSPDPVVNGTNLTYTINVTNGGPNPGTNAQMTASPHASLTFQSLTAPAGWTCTTPAVNAAGVVQCTNPSLASGASANFTLVVRVVASGSGGGTLQSTFSTSSSAQDPNNANNQVTVNTNWIGQTADLTITKSTLATTVAQGGTLTYTLSTTNAGPDAAANVTVTDTLPAQLRFQSITAPGGWTCTTPATGANGTVTCTTALLANGATANFTLVTTVAPNATGTITNSASVAFTGGTDPGTGNSSAAAGGVLIGGNADLAVTKTTPTTSVAPGGSINYTINVTNNGPDPAASVTVTDTLPASLLFQSITAPAGWTCTTPAAGATGTISCTAATLASGATATFTLATTAAANATGTITNSATASHSGTDGNGANNTGTSPSTTVTTPGADLSITKTTGATSATTGSTLSYTITVTNNGPAAATNVVVTDTLPAGTTFSSATPSQGTCSGSTTVTCSLGTLNAAATATITLSVTVTATSGTISNTATVTAATSDPNGGNNSGTTPPLPVTPAALPVEQIPTLSEWALIGLALLLVALAVRRI